jgi:hypothetical protein
VEHCYEVKILLVYASTIPPLEIFYDDGHIYLPKLGSFE